MRERTIYTKDLTVSYNEIKFEREMIKMNTLTIIIFIFFLALGYVLVTYRKNRASVEYDERQASIRNHGYKHAFIAIAISDSFFITSCRRA